MDWWKKLKMWQKGAIFLGAVHLFAYFIGLLLFGPVFGYLVIFLEYPWAYLYRLLKFPGDLLFFPFDLLIGTAFYVLIGTLFGWIIGFLSKRS
jgi:hypothetical protein